MNMDGRSGPVLGRVEVDGAGPGEGLSLAGEWLRITVGKPFAPGAPMAFKLEVDGVMRSLRGKASGSKRREDQRFDVTLRLMNLTRDDLDKLGLKGA